MFYNILSHYIGLGNLEYCAFFVVKNVIVCYNNLD